MLGHVPGGDDDDVGAGPNRFSQFLRSHLLRVISANYLIIPRASPGLPPTARAAGGTPRFPSPNPHWHGGDVSHPVLVPSVSPQPWGRRVQGWPRVTKGVGSALGDTVGGPG